MSDTAIFLSIFKWHCFSQEQRIIAPLNSLSPFWHQVISPYLLAEGYEIVPISKILLSGEYSIDHTGRQCPAAQWLRRCRYYGTKKGEFSYARELPLFYRPPCVAANVLRISNDWNKCCAGGSWHISSRGAVRDPDGLCMYRKAKYILLCIFSMTNFVVFIAKYFGYSDLRKSLP